jgi:predicted nucleic-acid-binding protein
VTISLDTNVIIRLFINDDVRQSAAALACLEHYDTVHLGSVALLETIYVLHKHYGLTRTELVGYTQRLLSHPKIRYDRAIFDAALSHYATHPALSIEDCCAAAQAHAEAAVPLLTFDRKLADQLQHADLLKV